MKSAVFNYWQTEAKSKKWWWWCSTQTV